MQHLQHATCKQHLLRAHRFGAMLHRQAASRRRGSPRSTRRHRRVRGVRVPVAAPPTRARRFVMLHLACCTMSHHAWQHVSCCRAQPRSHPTRCGRGTAGVELCRDNADRALERETAVLSLSGAKLSEQVRTAATSAPGLAAPLPHLHRDWPYRCHIRTGTGRTAATSAPGLRAPLPHLHRDWARPLPQKRQAGSAPVLPPSSAVVLVRRVAFRHRAECSRYGCGPVSLPRRSSRWRKPLQS